jgi:hypothetical protein
MQYNLFVPMDNNEETMRKILSTSPLIPFASREESNKYYELMRRGPLGYCEDVSTTRIGALPPGNPRTISHPRTMDLWTPTVSRTITVFGQLAYRDIFTKKERETTFCDYTFRFGEDEFKQYPTYNDMK